MWVSIAQGGQATSHLRASCFLDKVQEWEMFLEGFTRAKEKSQRESPKLKSMPPMLPFLILPVDAAAWV